MLAHISKFFTVFVSLQHLYFCYVQNYLWEKQTIRKDLYNMTEEEAKNTVPLGKYLSIFNGFLGLSILLSLYRGYNDLILLNLLQASVAGYVGGRVISRRLYSFQLVPALIALLLSFFSRN